MSKCLEYEDNCGMYNVKEQRCCLFCEHGKYCEGFCSYLEKEGLTLENAKRCSDFCER